MGSYGGLYEAWFLFVGLLVIGKLVSVLSFSKFRGSVLSFSNQKFSVTNPMSRLYISPIADKETRII